MNKRIRFFIIVIAVLLLAATALAVVKTLYSEEPRGETSEQIWPLQYEQTVKQYSEKFRVPMYVIYATIRAESNFRETVVSSAGAVGLMQIMPSTYEWLSSKGHLNEEYILESLTTPDTNIRVGTYYLSWLYSVFGDWELVSAAYNAGPGRVNEWMENPEYYENKKLIYIPIEETRNYVKKVMSYEETYKRMYSEYGWDDYSESTTSPETSDTTATTMN